MAAQSKLTWMATAAFGLEGVVAEELRALGIKNAKAEQGGARFEADPKEAYSALLWLRCADRVLLVVGEAKVMSFEELFQAVKAVAWEEYLPKDAAFPVSGKCARSQLMSVSDCQAITKKAIAERLKQHYKLNWFSEDGPQYPVDVSIHSDMMRLTIDASGVALNRRGYRTWNGEAPLRETLAAAIVRLSPWRPGMPLHDPCCGTGTLLIEAAMVQSNRAPGLLREFACDKWPLFPASQRTELREMAQAAYNPDRIEGITGSDINPEALELCKRHIAQAGMEGRIQVMQKDLRDLRLDRKNGVFLANPPYGERLGDRKSAEGLYKHMRLMLDRHEGWRMGILSSHPGFERCFGRRAPKKRRLYNGRLECELFLY